MRYLTILHTNDVHSQMDPWLRLASLIRRERAAAQGRGEAVLYVDAGDHEDRSVPEVEGTGGRVNLALLRAAGCDAATWGNGETVMRQPADLAALAAAAGYPVLLANLRAAGEGGAPIPGTRDTLILEVGGLRVGVFGLTVPFRELLYPKGLECPPATAAAARCVAALRAQGCHLVVCLSHLGLPRDRELARAVPGIDVIVGGHTHHALARPEAVGRTWIVQAGHRGAYLGRLRLAVDPAAGPVAAEGELLPVGSDLPADPEAAAVLAAHRAQAGAALAQVVAWLPRPIPHRLKGPAPLVQAVAQELRRRLGAQVALVNTGILLDGFPAGPVTRGMVLARCPSLLNGVKVALKGRQIRRALAQARDPERIFYRVWAGARGKYVGTLCAAGDIADLKDDRDYTVATLGFLALGFTGYDALAVSPEAIRWETGFTLRDLVTDVLRSWGPPVADLPGGRNG